jgi:hypothetical protein
MVACAPSPAGPAAKMSPTCCQETLEEEANADKILTHIAETSVNADAAHAS